MALTLSKVRRAYRRLRRFKRVDTPPRDTTEDHIRVMAEAMARDGVFASSVYGNWTMAASAYGVSQDSEEEDYRFT